VLTVRPLIIIPRQEKKWILDTQLSPEKAMDIAKTTYSIKVTAPMSKKTLTRTLILNQEQQELVKSFGF